MGKQFAPPLNYDRFPPYLALGPAGEASAAPDPLQTYDGRSDLTCVAAFNRCSYIPSKATIHFAQIR